MASSFAFISTGKLLVHDGSPALRTVESRFAREMEERHSAARQRHGWKAESDERVSGMPGAAVWGKQAIAHSEATRVEWTAVTRGPAAREITFALRVGDLGGLFENSLGEENERRLLHRQHLQVDDMERHPSTGVLAYAEAGENGTVQITLKEPFDSRGRQLTEGDSLDQAPSWVMGSEDHLVYQSAGLARNAQGWPIGIGPYVLHELDLKSGEVVTLLEDANHDLLLPHKLADGTLLFIQRPYEGRGRIHYGRLLIDTVMLPIRLVETLFHFLNFTSMIYSGKPLTRGGPVRTANADVKKLVLWGRAVEAEKEARRANPEEPRHLAPPSWQLIARRPDGSETVIAKRVLGYDVGSDGTILYTSGKTIYRCTLGTSPEPVLDHFPIEKLCALD
jgi:hypothetical protein